MRTTVLTSGVVAGVAGGVFGREAMLHWGSTPEEQDLGLAGDDLVAHPHLTATRAITIDCAPEAVWPWIAQVGQVGQVGQGRGGFNNGLEAGFVESIGSTPDQLTRVRCAAAAYVKAPELQPLLDQEPATITAESVQAAILAAAPGVRDQCAGDLGA